jgi:hypothetical protein
VISQSTVSPHSFSASPIRAATVAGGISDGVPPPKKIEPTLRPGSSAASCRMSAINASAQAA